MLAVVVVGRGGGGVELCEHVQLPDHSEGGGEAVLTSSNLRRLDSWSQKRLQGPKGQLARALPDGARKCLCSVDVRSLEPALVLQGGQSISNLFGFSEVVRFVNVIIINGCEFWQVIVVLRLQKVDKRFAPGATRQVLCVANEEIVAARAWCGMSRRHRMSSAAI